MAMTIGRTPLDSTRLAGCVLALVSDGLAVVYRLWDDAGRGRRDCCCGVIGEDPPLIREVAEDRRQGLADQRARDIVGRPRMQTEHIARKAKACFLQAHRNEIQDDERDNPVARHLGLALIECPQLVANIGKYRCHDDRDQLGEHRQLEHRAMIAWPWRRVDEQIEGEVIDNEGNPTNSEELQPRDKIVFDKCDELIARGFVRKLSIRTHADTLRCHSYRCPVGTCLTSECAIIIGENRVH